MWRAHRSLHRDGLLVYFGYPQAHEDDAQRGVRSGLGIVEAIRDLDAEVTHPDINLAVRIGITTGLVVAGDIGAGERVEEQAIVGETPNIAARLQEIAEPNTVVIGPRTHRLVEDLFDCDDLGAQKLKGISQEVNVYRVRAESDAPSHFRGQSDPWPVTPCWTGRGNQSSTQTLEPSDGR